MLDQLMVRAGHSVLEIGAGTGYNAALLAYLAGAKGKVATVDLDGDTVARARRNLARAGFTDVRVVEADGWLDAGPLGWFDRVEVTVGVWDIAPRWVDALSTEGILVVPLWLRGGLQVSVAFAPTGAHGLRSISVRPCGFMRLRGPHAGPEEYVTFHGWTASLDSPEVADAVVALTEKPPRIRSVPALVDHASDWYPRFLLDEPGAVSLVKEVDKTPTLGLLHSTGESLAVLDRDRVSLFGNDEAFASLVDAARAARPLDVTTLHITAAESAHYEAVRDAAHWTFVRPHYSFHITEE
jgi:protein-L-isoaspartate O-methyltransferase